VALIRGAVRGIRERTVSWNSDGTLWRDEGPNQLGFSLAKQGYMTSGAALSVSAVWRAASLLANVAASMPLHVYQDGSAGRQQIKLASEFAIWSKPNPEVNKFVFWSTVFFHLVLNGNAYIYVVPAADTSRRRPAELWPVEPGRVRVERVEGRKQYIIDSRTLARDWVAGGEIVHVQGLGTDGLRGLSPIALFAQSLGLALAAEEYAGAFFGNGSLPGGYLSSEQDITAAQAQAISEAWETHHRGTGNAHRVAVLGKGTKWNHTSLNPEDAQLLATRQFQVSDVARMFGVPEHLLGSHDKQSSWGTGIAEQNRGLLVYTLDPYVQNMELTISEELLMPSNHYAKFSREGLLRGDPGQRADFYSKLVALGVLTPNEIREKEDMEGIGADGDVRLRPANFVPLNAAAPAGYGNATPAAPGD